MTNEELTALIQDGEDCDGSLMLQLWQQNRGLIASVARKYAAYEDMEDLMQQGYMGLCDAVRGYRPEEGAAFSTYAVFWIRAGIQRYIEECGAVLRIPSGLRGQITRYRRACADFEKTQGRKPTEWEICCFMDMSREQVRKLTKAAGMCSIGSIDKPVDTGEEDITIGDLQPGAADVEGAVLDRVQQEQLKAVLWGLVDGLPGKQPEVIRMRYREGLTLKETGERLGIAFQGAREHERNGFRLLRQGKRAKQLRPFLDEYISYHAFHGSGIETFNRTWTSSTERVALRMAEWQE